MHSGDLTDAHLRALYDQLRPLGDYLYCLQSRMDAAGFSQADDLYVEVVAARSTMSIVRRFLLKGGHTKQHDPESDYCKIASNGSAYEEDRTRANHLPIFDFGK